ncbi:MAG: 30S ribosomal protein S19e [Candidatus Aenigmatarchaeota archaeon]
MKTQKTDVRVIPAIAKELQQHIQMPQWATFVKTGTGKQRPPEQSDWWYIRAASMLRRISIDGPVGISRLRTYYGSLKRRGHKPAHFRKGGGKVIRTIIQDLEKAGLIEKSSHKGRVLSKTGMKLLSKTAKQIDAV